MSGDFSKLKLTEGPINDFEWTPNGETFIVNAGHQPSKTEIYDNNGDFIKEISTSKTNTIKISPDSRVLCLAGFGNLGGDMEFFSLENPDNKSFKLQLGKTKFHCGVSINWSNDSKYIVVSVLSPRLRVDNEYKVYMILI